MVRRFDVIIGEGESPELYPNVWVLSSRIAQDSLRVGFPTQLPDDEVEFIVERLAENPLVVGPIQHAIRRRKEERTFAEAREDQMRPYLVPLEPGTPEVVAEEIQRLLWRYVTATALDEGFFAFHDTGHPPDDLRGMG